MFALPMIRFVSIRVNSRLNALDFAYFAAVVAI